MAPGVTLSMSCAAWTRGLGVGGGLVTIRYLLLACLIAAGAALAQESDSLDTYQGPSILSRGGSGIAGERAGRLVDFRFWGDLSGVYDSDLNGVIVNQSGGLQGSGAEYGLEAGGGVVGSKTWRHDQISVDYTGHFRHYTPNSFFDGTDQLLQFG